MTPPPASSEPASLTTEEVAEIRNSHTQIIVLMNQLLEKNGSQPSFPASHAASSAAGQTAASFVPTIMAVGTYGASSAIPLPLHSRFPDADTSVLVVIITHNFKAADLHKLDPTNRDRETTYTFNGLTNQFKISNWAAKEYKTPFLVLIPLQSYFQILMFHVNDCAATESFWAYIEQLLELVAEYKWTLHDHPMPLGLASHMLLMQQSGPQQVPEQRLGSWQGEFAPSLNFVPLKHIVASLPILNAHPNTNPCANSLTDTKSLPQAISSLNIAAWAYYLCKYPTQSFVSSIMQIIKFGTNLGFTGDYTLTLSANITTQVTNSQTHRPFSKAPFKTFHTLPIGAVHCKHSMKVCPIHHLSWLDGSSINNGISNAEASIAYDMVDRAIDDLIASGPGSLMLKLDLESTFHHIPVCSIDWPLLGFEWLGQLYYNVMLVFSMHSAPYIFNLFAEALHWILQYNLPAYMCHYLDDFLTIFPCLMPLPVIDKSLTVLNFGTQFSLTFQSLKIMSLAMTIKFLGLELDLLAMEV
ncbi:hypothetical protein E4T56_gene4071 [Termitomyces sp. T112]|nr:hypothetical protein E4T56_gene4071 [Termitomyces sp. T112]